MFLSLAEFLLALGRDNETRQPQKVALSTALVTVSTVSVALTVTSHIRLIKLWADDVEDWLSQTDENGEVHDLTEKQETA